ncbi:MAG: hypothetical protein SFU25_08960, partial [Candidatus Caenarcaniphilales bacterium]|nr:hypothetical protein [Candidatus Caenarcaniphilales bacterium]
IHSLEEQSQASSWNKLPEKEANDLDSVVLTMLGTLFPVFRYSSSRLADYRLNLDDNRKVDDYPRVYSCVTGFNLMGISSCHL